MEAPSTSASQSVGEESSGAVRLPRWFNKRVGRFRLLELLGKGSFGRVFLAEDVDLERRVALKILTADATARRLREEARAAGESMETTGLSGAVTEAVDRMIREARAAARLEHPGVVQIFEIGRLESQGLGGFIAMELLEGGTLQELVKQSGPLDIQRACTYIAEAAEALQYAHDNGVVHRDVKPGNLMLSRNGRCKVADFGMACISEPSKDEQVVAKGGTAAYMAPEVIRGSPPDPLSDQYALAATLFALLAGHSPFRAENKREILLAHLRSRVPNLQEIRPDIDERLWMIVRRGLCKHAQKRFETMAEFAAALEPYTARTKPASSGTFQEISLEQVLGPEQPIAVPEWMKGEAAPPPHAALKRFRLGGRFNSLLTTWPPPRWVKLTAVGLAVLVLLVIVLSMLAGSSADAAVIQPGAIESVGLASRQSASRPTSRPSYILATDYDRLLRIAQGSDPEHPNRHASVGGKVVHARTSHTGKVFRIYFEGTDRGRGFGVVYFPGNELFDRMEQKFGGTDGSGMEQKVIRVTGTVSIYQDNPQIIVESPDQVEIVDVRP